jgi:energy-coupling factor transport system ATP-binding protein
MTYGLKLLNFPPEEIVKRAEEALKMFNLFELKETGITQLPLSAKRRLTVASLIALGTRNLILDEPTNGLDTTEAQTLMGIIQKLYNEGRITSYILISHNMELVSKYTDRVIVMSQGQILLDGPTRDVFYKPEILKQAYLLPPQVARFCQSLNIFTEEKLLTVDELKNYIQLINT